MGRGRGARGHAAVVSAPCPHLVLRLEAPVMSFGAEAIDNYGVVQDFPALSMVTGLLANALGWRRGWDADRHQRLQDRLVMAARLDREGRRFRDYQTAQLLSTDRYWTTRGKPEGREWNSSTWGVDERHQSRTGEKRYAITHQRYRDHDADRLCVVVVRLEPPGDEPSLADLERALLEPARPLFIGRKPCLPSAMILHGRAEGATVLDALMSGPRLGEPEDKIGPKRRAMWPMGEGEAPGREVTVTDERNWRGGLHGGGRRVVLGEVRVAAGGPA
jgi:CRISPR system Cascade subunit CasD